MRFSIGPDSTLLPLVKLGQAPELRLLFLLGRADQLELLRDGISERIAEGVDADDGVGAVVLAVLVHIDSSWIFAALVARFHRAEHPPRSAIARTLSGTASSTSSVSSSMNERAWLGVLVLSPGPIPCDDELYRHGAAALTSSWAW